MQDERFEYAFFEGVKEIFETGLLRGKVKFNEPLSGHTSLRIGGPARVLVFPDDVVSLKNVLVMAKEQGIPIFIIGAGTNLLVRESGINGIVVSLKELRRIAIIEPPRKIFWGGTEGVTLFVEAGVPLRGLINFTKENGCSGIEELAGIPGSLGGAIYMNAGSFGKEIKDVLTGISVMKMDGEISVFEKEELKFSYRGCSIPENSVILSANIVLKKDSPHDVGRRIKEFIEKRMNTQPIGEHSAGCVFKNPEGDSAGRLIDMAGCKGMRIGDIEVSSLHGNFFINRGRATSEDFIKLMEIVKAKVKGHSGITLEPEIKII